MQLDTKANGSLKHAATNPQSCHQKMLEKTILLMTFDV